MQLVIIQKQSIVWNSHNSHEYHKTKFRFWFNFEREGKSWKRTMISLPAKRLIPKLIPNNCWLSQIIILHKRVNSNLLLPPIFFQHFFREPFPSPWIAVPALKLSSYFGRANSPALEADRKFSRARFLCAFLPEYSFPFPLSSSLFLPLHQILPVRD